MLPRPDVRRPQVDDGVAIGLRLVPQLVDEAGSVADDTISCRRGSRGDEQLIVSEVYFAGALVLRYLADRFGEVSHIRILDSGRTTLTEAIADEQPPGETPGELFDHFRNWMYENYGLGEPVP